MNDFCLDKLLNEMLINPQSDAKLKIAQFIETDHGYDQFLESLTANNPLAFIYLKYNINIWISNNINEKYYSDNFIRYICGIVNTRNIEFFCEYLHTLSSVKKIQIELIHFFIDNKKYAYLRAIFKKFTIEERSDDLYKEINSIMVLIQPLLESIYQQQDIIQIISKCPEQITQNDAITQIVNICSDFNNSDLLEIIYCLLWQDIPGYFEDHARYFFKIFYILYKQQREIILKIFEIFVTKYAECADIQLLTRTFAEDTLINSTVLGVLTKAAQHITDNSTIRTIMSRALIFKINCSDMATYTKDMLAGTDIDRGAIVRLIRLLRPNEDDFIECGLEPQIFIATVLKKRNEKLLTFCRQLITSEYVNFSNNIKNTEKIINDTINTNFSTNNIINDITLGFTAFNYLITLKEFGPCSSQFLNNDLRFICLKYMSLSLHSLDRFHTISLLSRLGKNIEPIILSPIFNEDSIRNFYSFDFCRAIINSIIENYKDWPNSPSFNEFSTELLFRIIQFHPELATIDLHTFISFIFNSIELLDMQSLHFLFDTYLFLTNRLGIVNLKFIEHIINNELTDHYSHCFFYLSILLYSGNAPADFILNVLGQDILWTEPLYVSSLVFLTISAFHKNCVSVDEVLKFSSKISPFYSLILLLKCSITQVKHYPVEQFLLNGIFDSDWFLGNFIEKKYTRLVLKKLLTMPIQQDIQRFIIEKNIINIEYEYTYRSIIEFFDV